MHAAGLGTNALQGQTLATCRDRHLQARQERGAAWTEPRLQHLDAPDALDDLRAQAKPAQQSERAVPLGHILGQADQVGPGGRLWMLLTHLLLLAVLLPCLRTATASLSSKHLALQGTVGYKASCSPAPRPQIATPAPIRSCAADLSGRVLTGVISQPYLQQRRCRWQSCSLAARQGPLPHPGCPVGAVLGYASLWCWLWHACQTTQQQCQHHTGRQHHAAPLHAATNAVCRSSAPTTCRYRCPQCPASCHAKMGATANVQHVIAWRKATLFMLQSGQETACTLPQASSVM